MQESESRPSIATGAALTRETFAEFVERLRHHCVGEGVRDHFTTDAVFEVHAREYTYGIDPEYDPELVIIRDDHEWTSPDAFYAECDPAEKYAIDKEVVNGGWAAPGEGFEGVVRDDSKRDVIVEALPDVRVVGRKAEWVHVNTHFTREAAEAFIRRKKHDYPNGLRIYVEAQLYCWEFNAIKEALISGKLVYSD